MTQVRSAADGLDSPEGDTTGRPLRRRRGLPSGRAVVGGFLVALATVGVFAAYTEATAKPQISYVVAARDIAPGEQLTGDMLELVPLDLPDEQRRRSYDVVAPLLEATVVEPLLAGELIQEGSLVVTGASQGSRTVSFAIDAAHAVNGSLRAGERIDILSTFGTGDESCTHQVASDVPVVAVNETTGSLVAQGGTTMTVEVGDAATGLAVAHAANAGTITLVRATHAQPQTAERFCTPASQATEAPAAD